MKPIPILFILFLLISCSEPNELQPTVNQQVINKLTKEGHKVFVINDSEMIVTGFSNLNEFVIRLNRIYDEIGKPERKIQMDDDRERDLSGGRMTNIECHHSWPYPDGDGYWCMNYTCSGSREEVPSYFDCYGEECISFGTTCTYVE